jgi:hypothetical protein
MYEGKENCRVVVGKSEGGSLENLGVGGKIVLK